MKILTLILAGGLLLGAPVAALAHTGGLHDGMKNIASHLVIAQSTNLLDKAGDWKSEGAVSFGSDGVMTLSESSGESELAYKDVDVTGLRAHTAVFVSYTKAENVREGDITGLPYLYGYAMDADGKILRYYQGGRMLREKAASGAWVVNSGIFGIPKGTTTIRFFLQQAEKSGGTQQGDDAMFFMPGLYVTHSSVSAANVIAQYRFGLSLL